MHRYLHLRQMTGASVWLRFLCLLCSNLEAGRAFLQAAVGVLSKGAQAALAVRRPLPAMRARDPHSRAHMSQTCMCIISPLLYAPHKGMRGTLAWPSSVFIMRSCESRLVPHDEEAACPVYRDLLLEDIWSI